MRIAYAVFGQVTVANGRPNSPQASIRYRVLRPAEPMARRGWNVNVAAIDPETPLAQAQAVLAERDIVVLSSPLNPVAERLQAMARSYGARTVLDICDNHFAGSALEASYRALCRDAHCVTVPTPELAEAVHTATGRRAEIIPDPVEGPRGTPCFPKDASPLRVLWFGGMTNLDTLPGVGRALAPVAALRPVALTLVTANHPDVRAFLSALPPGIAGRLVPWSPEALWIALAECHAVVLPSVDHPLKRGKSANRLTEALWAGRWVVAHPLPAFGAWSDTAGVAEDLGQALLWGLAHPDAVLHRIAAAQERIARTLSTEAVSARWAALFEEVAGRGVPL